MKKIMIGLLMSSVLFVGCASKDSENTETSTTEVSSSEVVETKSEEKTQQEKELLTLTSLQTSYDGVAQITLDREQKTYFIDMIDKESFADSINFVLDGSLDSSRWTDSVVNPLVELSATISKNIGSGYSLSIPNPVKSDEVILVVSDGQVVFDAVSDNLPY